MGSNRKCELKGEWTQEQLAQWRTAFIDAVALSADADTNWSAAIHRGAAMARAEGVPAALAELWLSQASAVLLGDAEQAKLRTLRWPHQGEVPERLLGRGF